MRTEKQIAASRENGSKSGYPLGHATTPEGKARIVNANLICGIDADTEVLMWEHRNELEELKAEYYANHPPPSPLIPLRRALLPRSDHPL